MTLVELFILCCGLYLTVHVLDFIRVIATLLYRRAELCWLDLQLRREQALAAKLNTKADALKARRLTYIKNMQRAGNVVDARIL